MNVLSGYGDGALVRPGGFYAGVEHVCRATSGEADSSLWAQLWFVDSWGWPNDVQGYVWEEVA